MEYFLMICIPSITSSFSHHLKPLANHVTLFQSFTSLFAYSSITTSAHHFLGCLISFQVKKRIFFIKLLFKIYFIFNNI